MRPFLYFVFTLITWSLFAQVRYHGSMGQMGKTNFRPVVSMDSLQEPSGLFGLGPYAYMQGELTVVDGNPYVGMRSERGKMLVRIIEDATAPFFVYAHVKEWKTSSHQLQISEPLEIERWIESMAEELRLDLSTPFPFRIKAVIDQLTVHVVMPRSADVSGYIKDQKSQKYDYTDISGELVGFYSQSGQGIYTHSDSRIHVHFVSDDRLVVGHVDQLQMGLKNIRFSVPSAYSPIEIADQ